MKKYDLDIGLHYLSILRKRPTTYLIIFLVCLSFCIIFEEEKTCPPEAKFVDKFFSLFYVNGDAKKALRVGLSEGFFFECIMCLGQKNS